MTYYDATMGGGPRQPTPPSLILHYNANRVFKADVQGLHVGSNIDAPANTAFSVFSYARTYNTEAMGAGDVLCGDNSASRGNLLYDNSAGTLALRVGTASRVLLATTGTVTIGDTANEHVIISGTAIQQKDGSTILFQVSGGNVTMGQVATNQGNVFWNTSNKRLEFRGGANGTVVQAYVDTTGAITAGAGNVTADVDGVTLVAQNSVSATVASSTSIKWVYSGTTYGKIEAKRTDGIMYISALGDIAEVRQSIYVTPATPALRGKTYLVYNSLSDDAYFCVADSASNEVVYVGTYGGYNGLVGINTSTPAYQLEVNGTLGVSGAITFSGATGISGSTAGTFTALTVTNTEGSLNNIIAIDFALTNVASNSRIGAIAEDVTAGTRRSGLVFYTASQADGGTLLRWQMTSAGHLLATTDNSWDIGASGATRPRNIYAGTLVTAPTVTGTTLTGTLSTAAQTNVTQVGTSLGIGAAASAGYLIEASAASAAAGTEVVGVVNTTTTGTVMLSLSQAAGSQYAWLKRYNSTHATLANQLELFNFSNAQLRFGTNNTLRGYIGAAGELVWGTPGGVQTGAGVINAVSVYDDGVLLTDAIWDHYYDGQVRPEDAGRWAGLRLYSIAETEAFTRAHRHLPSLPGRNEWQRGRKSAGEMITHLWETIERQQIQIYELQGRA